MHLSRVMVSWKIARNPYEIHRALWGLFPDRPDQDRNFLFRVEKVNKGLGADILMQSECEPATGNLHCSVIAHRECDAVFNSGQRLRFRLRANPIKTIVDALGRSNKKGETKKCRVPLIHEEQQRAWLQRKFNSACHLETLVIHREQPIFFKKSKELRTGKIQTVLFDGILRINSPDEFIHELGKGIGPAKAFGCGLLSVA